MQGCPMVISALYCLNSYLCFFPTPEVEKERPQLASEMITHICMAGETQHIGMVCAGIHAAQHRSGDPLEVFSFPTSSEASRVRHQKAQRWKHRKLEKWEPCSEHMHQHQS
jgi:hypothetical protein